MDLRLFSLERVPPSVPIWDAIIDDLGRPPPERVARALGVGRSTVYRWNATQKPPRMASLALFWLTRWGHSAIHTQATNDAVLAVQLARSLSEDRLALQEQVHQLEAANRVLRFQAVSQVQPRDSAAIADRSHTGTSSAAHPAEPDTTLSWPPLALPLPELPVLPPAGDAGRPGSPAETPPEAHSTTGPGFGHTPQPQPSVRGVVAESLPSLEAIMSEWRHSATTFGSSCDLLVLRQAPQSKTTDAARTFRLGRPDAGKTAFMARSGQGVAAAALPASTRSSAPTASVQLPERPGTPASASLASLRFHGATAPCPAWSPSSTGAPPGQGVFAAISTACTTPPTTSRNPK